MREGRMRKVIKKHFGKRILIQPIESHATTGIPDIFFFDQEPGWAELKEWNGEKVPFGPGQFAWLTNYWKRGGLALLITTSSDNLWIVFQNENIQRSYANEEWVNRASWIGSELPETSFRRIHAPGAP